MPLQRGLSCLALLTFVVLHAHALSGHILERYAVSDLHGLLLEPGLKSLKQCHGRISRKHTVD